MRRACSPAGLFVNPVTGAKLQTTPAHVHRRPGAGTKPAVAQRDRPADPGQVWLGVAGRLRLVHRGAPPRADGQQRAKQDDGVDAFASLGGPIGFGAHVEPEREFVEGEGCAMPKAMEMRRLAKIEPGVEPLPNSACRHSRPAAKAECQTR